MARQRLDPKLLATLRAKTNKSEKYLREQISRKANRAGISSEAELILWAKRLGIGTATYQRKLTPNIQGEVRDGLPSVFVGDEARRDHSGKKVKPRVSQRSSVQAAIDYLLEDAELRDRCKDLLKASKHFDRVFRAASTVFDDRLKKMANITNMNPTNLVGKVLNPDPQKAIVVVSPDRDEQEVFFSICKGLVLTFRNTTHHSLSNKFTREDALKFCRFVDAILGVLKQATVHPERV